ncbi:MAG: hypothetical protein RJB31_1722, partial [Bacteroidota bacterium]
APLESVYSFDLSKFNLTAEKQKLVAGIQANIWTETMQNEKRLDYMLFPRMAGLAEAAWRNKNIPKDYNLFRERLQGHLGLYANAGLYYFDPSAPTIKLEPIGPPKK